MLLGRSNRASMANKSFVVLPADEAREADGWIEKNASLGLPACPYHTKHGTIAICGNGPSLRTVYPSKGPIAALNGAWRTLVANGVMPDYIIAHDPCAHNVAWFDDCPDEPTYLLASSVHPSVYEKLKGKKVCQWYPNGDVERRNGYSPLIGGGFTIGCVSLNLLNLVGYTRFEIYGIDSCYAEDGSHHASDQGWNITQPRVFTVGEQSFLAEDWMAAQVEHFLEQIEENRRKYAVDVKCPGFLKAAIEHNTLEVLYDLDVAPGSFDFMCSMLNVENFREKCGFSRVHVHLKPGKDRGFRPNEIVDVKHEQKNQMLNKVVRPLIEMYGFEEVGSLNNPVQFQYSPKESLDYYRETGKLPVYEANATAKRWAANNYSDRPYVITLREAEYWPQRNSDVAEWVKFAKTLDRRVIFIRDTAKAFIPIEGFETCPTASLDLHARLTLYRAACMNFFVPNGPGGLAWYSKDIPYLTFYKSAPGYHCHSTEFLKEHVGLDAYGQFPWASERQRLIYADDTFENIQKAYLEMNKTQIAA